MERFFVWVNELLVISLKKVFYLEEGNVGIYDSKILQFVKFGIVGLSNTLISYLVCLILYSIKNSSINSF